MQTKKKKEFNKIVRELNDKLSYTNYLLLEYNDKHIREKIEEKFNNSLIDSDTILVYYIGPAEIEKCKATLNDTRHTNNLKIYTRFTFEQNLTAKFSITKIDTNTYHAEILRGLNIESPRGYKNDGSLSNTAKYITKMTAFYIDNLKQTHKN